MTNNTPKYYNWAKTLSYDADVTMVVGARGVGKTYGIRKQCVNDYIKHGYRFVEISRYKAETKEISPGYFDKIAAEFPEYQFKTDSKAGYIAKREIEDDEVKTKTDWHVICYFVALSDLQKTKRRTFANVKRLIMDEAIIDKTDRYHHYLPDEYTILANIVDSCSRERADDDSIEPRLYLLGNAVDIINPYFARYGISDEPKRGYTWHDGKHMILHFVDDAEYAHSKQSGTVAGRMLAGTAAGRVAAENVFDITGKEQIQQKPPRAKFDFALIWHGQTLAYWYDYKEELWYVTGRAPANARSRTYALTPDDAGVDLVVFRSASPHLKQVKALLLLNGVRYETARIRDTMLKIFKLCNL